MKKFIIKGPNKAIKGNVKISGAKNSCLPIMAASTELWRDDVHVIENRDLYRQKIMTQVTLMIKKLNCNLELTTALSLWISRVQSLC